MIQLSQVLKEPPTKGNAHPIPLWTRSSWGQVRKPRSEVWAAEKRQSREGPWKP